MQSERVYNIVQADRSVSEALLVRHEGWRKERFAHRHARNVESRRFADLTLSLFILLHLLLPSKNDYGH